MIEHAFIVSIIVIFIHITYQEDEVFGWLGNWFERRLPDFLHKPVFDCPICMTPWYGSLVMLAAGLTGVFPVIDTAHWIFTILIAAGISTVYVEWKPKDEIEVKNKATISQPEQPKERIEPCHICGGATVLIRGKYPGCDKRNVCPQCTTERLEQIEQIANPSYGQTCKA